MTLVTIPLLLEAGCIWCTDASTTTVTDDDEHFPITTSSKSMNPTPIQGIVLSNPELKIRKNFILQPLIAAKWSNEQRVLPQRLHREVLELRPAFLATAA